jgi:hypothetical protein
MSALEASRAHPQRSLSAKGEKTAAVYLGQLSAGTYARLPVRMQAACREMVKLGEITIEDMPSMPAGR